MKNARIKPVAAPMRVSEVLANTTWESLQRAGGILLCSYRSCEYFDVQVHLWVLKSKETLTCKCCVVWLRHYQLRLPLGFSLLRVVQVVIAKGLAPCPNRV